MEFIGNVLSKIRAIPGVGDILNLVDKALEPIFGFIGDLLPDPSQIGFPSFDMGINADFLNFGALTTAFDNLALPRIQLQDVLGNTISSLASKFSETPLGQVASCATDIECLQNAVGLGDLQDKLESLTDEISVIVEKLGPVLAHDPSDLISCEGESSVHNISCSEVFSLFDLDEEECIIELPSCKLNTTLLEDALSDVAEMFEDGTFGDSTHRRLSSWCGAQLSGRFLPLLPLHLTPHFFPPGLSSKSIRFRTSFAGDWIYPKQQIGFHGQVQTPFVLNLGLYNSECGRVKFAFEFNVATEFLFGFTHTFKNILKRTIDIAEDLDQSRTSDAPHAPWNMNPYCYKTGTGALGTCDKTLKGKDWRKRWKCKWACDADEMIRKPSDFAQQHCTKEKLHQFLGDYGQKELDPTFDFSKLPKSTQKTAKKCVEYWWNIRRTVMRKTDYTAAFFLSWRKWGFKVATNIPLPAGLPIWIRNGKDVLNQFYYGAQIGAGLVAYDTRTRTKFGPTVWFCPACDQPGNPVMTDLGLISPAQFKTPRTIADTSVYLRVAAKFSFGVVSLGKNKEADGKAARAVLGPWAKDYNCAAPSPSEGGTNVTSAFPSDVPSYSPSHLPSFAPSDIPSSAPSPTPPM